MRRLLPLLLLFAIACEREEPHAPQKQPSKSGRRPVAAAPGALSEPADNLLELAHGGSVVSRTGENVLEMSAAHLIDGDLLTLWKSPPHDFANHDLVFALPALSRVTTVGVHATNTKWEVPVDLRFEFSNDASQWREVLAIKDLGLNERRLASIPPTEARYVRVRVLPGPREQFYTQLRSIQIKGEELAQPKMPDLAGCWTVNGVSARFEQRGPRVFGVINTEPPTFVSGARDARTFRLLWLRGPQWGQALLTIEPQRRAFSAVKWHEIVGPSDATGEAWFGKPSSCGAAVELDEIRIARMIFDRAKRWTAYSPQSLEVFASLISSMPQARFRVVARTDERRDIVRALLDKQGVDLKRVEFTTAPPSEPPRNESIRVMADGVDLQVQ